MVIYLPSKVILQMHPSTEIILEGRRRHKIAQSSITRASQRLPDIGSRNASALGEMAGNASPHFDAARNSCPAGGQLTLRPGAVVGIARFSAAAQSLSGPLPLSHDIMYVRSPISHLHSPFPDSCPPPLVFRRQALVSLLGR